MPCRGGGSNTTHALLSLDPETLPIGKGVPPSHRRAPRDQGAPRPTDSGSQRSLNGRSGIPSESEIRPRHYPLGVGAENGLFQPKLRLARKTPKLTPRLDQPIPFEYKLSGALTQPGFPLSSLHQGATGSPSGVMMPKSPKFESSPQMARSARVRPIAHRIGGGTWDPYLSEHFEFGSGLLMGTEIWGCQLTTRGAEIGVPKGGHFGCSK